MVDEAHQRVMAEGFLPGRNRVFLVGVRDHQNAVQVHGHTTGRIRRRRASQLLYMFAHLGASTADRIQSALAAGRELMEPQPQPETAAALLSDLEDAERRRDEHSPHALTGDDFIESIVDTLLNPFNHAYLQFGSAYSWRAMLWRCRTPAPQSRVSPGHGTASVPAACRALPWPVQSDGG